MVGMGWWGGLLPVRTVPLTSWWTQAAADFPDLQQSYAKDRCTLTLCSALRHNPENRKHLIYFLKMSDRDLILLWDFLGSIYPNHSVSAPLILMELTSDVCFSEKPRLCSGVRFWTLALLPAVSYTENQQLPQAGRPLPTDCWISWNHGLLRCFPFFL